MTIFTTARAASRIVYLVTWAEHDVFGGWGLIGVCETKRAARERIRESRALFEKIHGIATARLYGITPTILFTSTPPSPKKGKPTAARERGTPKRTK